MLTKRLWKLVLVYAAVVLTIAGGALFAGDPGALLGRQEVSVIAPATLRAGVEEVVIVRALSSGGAPLAGVAVEATLHAQDGGPARSWPLGRSDTGADGTATLRFRLPADAAAASARLDVVATSVRGTERITLEPALAAGGPGAARVLLTPVKTLWKPGETIQARALVLGSDGAALAGEAVAFDLLSPGGTRIHRERTCTSAFGIASLSFALDAEAEEGAWRLRLVRLAGDGAEDAAGAPLAERALSVKRYRLPAFRAAAEPARRAVRPGDSVKATLAALTFEGRAVAGARFDAVLVGDGGEALGRTSATADDAGRADVSLSLPASFPLGPLGERRVFLEVEAKDAADRVATTAAVLFASEVPLRVSALPEGGALVPGVSNRLYLVLEGPGGVPEGGEVEVALPDVAPVVLRTGEEGVVLLDGVRPSARDVEAREMRIDVLARSGRGTAAARQTLAVKVDGAAAGVLRCERAVYSEGETVQATLLLGSGRRLRADATVIALLERDGRTVTTTALLPLDDGSGARGAFALPPSGAGLYRIAALLPEGDELREVARRVLVKGDLEVSLAPEKQEVAPGEEVKLRARARRAGGGPLGPCVVGIQAVDRAVAELGHAVDLRAEVLAVALGADPSAGRLGRGFAASLLDGGALGAGGDVAQAALGGAAGNDHQERIEATTAPACRTRDLLFREDARRYAFAALLALLPAAFFGALVYFPGALRNAIALLVLGAIVVAIATPNLVESRKGSNEAAAIGALRTLSTATALKNARDGRDLPISTGPKSVKGATERLEPPAPAPRSYFPEALLFAPEVLLDEKGEALVAFPTADALTEWRIDAVASTRAGALAHAQASIVSRQVFQVDLSAPPFVREGDELEVLAVTRNDGDRALAASLSLAQEGWFEALSPLEAGPLPVAPGGVASARFRLRALRPGDGALTVRARGEGGGPEDAARRAISVRAARRPLTLVRNGALEREGEAARVVVVVPGGEDASEGALDLRLTASPLAEAIEGIESMLREPHGCFEQTSSSTWPNTLILRYLRGRADASPEVTARAQRLVRAGAQRLAGFEVAGGGFSLYGQAPASPWLSAYGLRELTDIAREVPVDPDLLARARRFVLSTQRPDGSFAADGSMAHRDLDPGDGTWLATTAYVLAALVQAGETDPAVDRAGEWVAQAAREPRSSSYALALAGEALEVWGKRPEAVAGVVETLLSRGRRLSPAEGGAVEMSFDDAGRTLAGSYGSHAGIETAAVAARLLEPLPERRDAAAAAVRTVLRGRAPGGGWWTTQTTVQALTTLLRSGTTPARGSIEVAVGDAPPRAIALESAADALGRSQAVRLGERLAPGSSVTVALRSRASSRMSFQLVASASAPWRGAAPEQPARERGRPSLRLAVRYAALEVGAGEPLALRVEVANEGDASAAAPMLDLPFPAGFELASDRPLDEAIAQGWLARRDEVGSGLVLYLADLGPGERRALDLRLTGRFAGVLASGAARAYPYYNPEDASLVPPVVVKVSAGK